MPPEMKLSSQSETHELGRLLRKALSEFMQIELAYQDAGAERTAEAARALALKSLKLKIRLVRAGLRIQDRHQRRRSGDQIGLQTLACAPVPSALSLLYFELSEAHAGRIAPLLRHDTKKWGKGPYNHLRRYTKAGAAAAVQVLRETGKTEDEAATWVADALNKSGFPNTRNQPFSRETILDWHASAIATDPWQRLKDGFEDLYREWLLFYRGMVGRITDARRVGISVTEEELRTLLLFRLGNLNQVFGYKA
jgi:hypothetical protein